MSGPWPPPPTWAIGVQGDRYHLLGATIVPGLDRYPVFVRMGEEDWASSSEVADVIDEITAHESGAAS